MMDAKSIGYDDYQKVRHIFFMRAGFVMHCHLIDDCLIIDNADHVLGHMFVFKPETTPESH